MKLPAETIQTLFYNPATKQQEPCTVTLDDGRMPTVMGRAGVVADRSASKGAMRDPAKVYLFPVYMLARLRCPVGHVNEHWVLILKDLQFYRQDEHLRNLHEAQQPGRYVIQLWDAAVEEDETGNPDLDVSWDMLNPEMQFDVPLDYSLHEARIMTETLARLLAHGKAHPVHFWPSPEKHEREWVKRRAAALLVFQRLTQVDAGLAHVWNLRKGQQLQRWKWRGPKRYIAAVTQALHGAVKADRAARRKVDQPQTQRRRLTRALERGGEYQLKRDQPWQFASYTMTSKPLELVG